MTGVQPPRTVEHIDKPMQFEGDFEGFDILAESRLLILAPHPDDEALATGGLLQRAQSVGARVCVVFLTDGENNPWPQRVADRRWSIGARERARWGARRRGEALRSLRTLGVTPDRVSFLGFPDQHLTALLTSGDPSLARVLSEVLAEQSPTHVFSPSTHDHHSDHSAAAVAVRGACARRGRHHAPRLFEYVVHDGKQIPAVRVIRLSPTADEVDRKHHAIACHLSQLFFRRAELLAFATHDEVFFEPAIAGSDEPMHPIRAIQLDRGQLRLSLHRAPCLRAWGPASLVLLYPSLHRMRRTLRITLSWRSSDSAVRFADGRVASQHAAYTGGPYCGELCVPAALLPRLLPGFAKIDARFGFFDEAGWRALPLLTIANKQELRDRIRRLAAPAPGSSRIGQDS